MSLEREPDHVLLRRWRDGDSNAGGRLVERHFARVFGFFARRMSDLDGARDLTQEAFLLTLKLHDRLRREDRYQAFLLGVARNVLARHARTHGMARRGLDPELASAATTPGGLLIRRQEQRLLLHALRGLAEDDQLIIELHYWEELTSAEIARVLEIAPGTVRWRLMKARQALKARIDGAPDPRPLRDSTSLGFERWARSMRRRVDDPTSG